MTKQQIVLQIIKDKEKQMQSREYMAKMEHLFRRNTDHIEGKPYIKHKSQ